jgi:putative DNA primase/helicase
MSSLPEMPIAKSGRTVNPVIEELADAARWVCWKSELRPDANGKLKETKPPYRIGGRFKARSTDPSTWSSFDRCWESAFTNQEADGVGFVLDDSDGLMGADLDDCIEDGKIAPWALELVEMFDSYTERSPSGAGLRIIFRSAKGQDWGLDDHR